MKAAAFVIDGSQALRKTIEKVFGQRHPIQRAADDKLRNVLGICRRITHPQAQAAFRAAMKLATRSRASRSSSSSPDGSSRDHPSASASLREGLSEMFRSTRVGSHPLGRDPRVNAEPSSALRTEDHGYDFSAHPSYRCERKSLTRRLSEEHLQLSGPPPGHQGQVDFEIFGCRGASAMRLVVLGLLASCGAVLSRQILGPGRVLRWRAPFDQMKVGRPDAEFVPANQRLPDPSVQAHRARQGHCATYARASSDHVDLNHQTSRLDHPRHAQGTTRRPPGTGARRTEAARPAPIPLLCPAAQVEEEADQGRASPHRCGATSVGDLRRGHGGSPMKVAARSRRDRIRTQLADLKMPGALEALDEVLSTVDGGGVTASEAIEQLLGAQITLRNNRRLQAAMRSSRLPAIKTLTDFDFSFQPSIKREQIDSLHELGFLERKENVILLGPPGVGKTHLAISLAIAAAQSGRRVYYGALADLITSLEEAKAADRLGHRLKTLTHPALLVVDEIGYLPVNQTGAMLFFQLINRRYERASTVLTSNKGFEEWGDVLGDEVMAAALIDRLLHHCHIVNIRGNSYRMRHHTDLSKVLHSPPAESSSSPPRKRRRTSKETTTT